MSALMCDIVEEVIDPRAANAACTAGAKLLKVVEMQYKYGRNASGGEPKALVLTKG